MSVPDCANDFPQVPQALSNPCVCPLLHSEVVGHSE